MCSISVIVPVYNVEKYLVECLDSILKQDFADVEVICVEDVSTDNSRSLLREYAKWDERIKLILNEKNGGLSYSRNVGLRQATGKYVMFVDSDDMLTDNALRELYTYAEERKTDGVVFNMQSRFEGNAAKEKFVNKDVIYGSQIPEKVMSGKELFCQYAQKGAWRIEACRYFWRTDFLKANQLQFYDGLIHEDNLFSFFALMHVEQIANLNKEYYIYRRHDNSITSSLTRRHVESLFVIFNEIYAFWKMGSFTEEVNAAITKYMDFIYNVFQKKKSYFDSYGDLTFGSAADNYLYKKFLDEKELILQYAFLENEKLEQLKQAEQVIIYGAGSVGVEAITLLERENIAIGAVAVSNADNNMPSVKGYEVQSIYELQSWNKKAIVLVAVVERHYEGIKQTLKELEFENVMFFDKKC